VVDSVGPYLGTVPYVLRGWAKANAATLVAYPAFLTLLGASGRRISESCFARTTSQ
jgi:hypothetical protein